jgi:hypothetical protein
MQEDDVSAATADVDMKKRWREQQDDVMFPDEVRQPSLQLPQTGSTVN